MSSLLSGASFRTTFPAALYYPALFAGRNAPPVQAGPPMPVVGFAVGWTCDVAMYEAILQRLASHGLLVVAPLFNDASAEPLAQVNFRSQLSQILSAVAYVGAQAGPAGGSSPFGDPAAGTLWRGRVNASRLGLFGHSAGGGVVLQGAAERGDAVRAVATLGAWVNPATTPWLSALGGTVTAPALLLSGANDTLAPLADNGQRVFDALASPKLLPLLAGGSHCFLDWSASQQGAAPANGLLPWYGYSGCPAAQLAALPPPLGVGGLSMGDQVAQAATHLTTFFKLYLADDADGACVLCILATRIERPL